MANRIDFTLGTTLDKTGIVEFKKAIDEIVKKTQESGLIDTEEFGKFAETLWEVQEAYSKAFNSKTGEVNIQKFNSSLKTAGINLNDVYVELSRVGGEGKTAFRDMAVQALTANQEIKKTNTFLTKMAETFVNTARWQVTSAIVNKISGSFQEAYGYVKNLDSSLNDIRIVTGKSADEMERFAKNANTIAASLGKTTTDYTEASLTYYRQGLSDEEVEARATTTLKASNITGQSAEDVADNLTAVWNGYKVAAEDTELYVDKLAAVASSTASDLEELSTGMSKVASAANNMGVDMDQLNAMLATVISVTRQAPESVGTALIL